MDNETFDLNEFLERVQNDKELLLELLDIFTNDFKEKRVLLDKAVSQKNYEEVKSISHSLKGASGNISAKDLRETLLQLEQMGKNGDITSAANVLAELDRKFSELTARLANVNKELQELGL